MGEKTEGPKIPLDILFETVILRPSKFCQREALRYGFCCVYHKPRMVNGIPHP